MYVCMSLSLSLYIYIHTCTCTHIYTHAHIIAGLLGREPADPGGRGGINTSNLDLHTSLLYIHIYTHMYYVHTSSIGLSIFLKPIIFNML